MLKRTFRLTSTSPSIHLSNILFIHPSNAVHCDNSIAGILVELAILRSLVGRFFLELTNHATISYFEVLKHVS